MSVLPVPPGHKPEGQRCVPVVDGSFEEKKYKSLSVMINDCPIQCYSIMFVLKIVNLLVNK